MSWRWRYYDRVYRRGAPPWDSGVTPPEVVDAIEGRVAPPPPGRALDLGCGTGTNVRYLVEHGYETVGVDFSPLAVDRARERLAGVPGVTLHEGDVTRLADIGVSGPFVVLLDIGCFHGIQRGRRDAYVDGVTRVAPPGALLLLFAFARRGVRAVLGTGVGPNEIPRRFAWGWRVERVIPGTHPPGAAWYLLRRS